MLTITFFEQFKQAPDEESVEFEYAAPTALQDTAVHVDTPMELTNLLPPQKQTPPVDAKIQTPKALDRQVPSTSPPRQQQQQQQLAPQQTTTNTPASGDPMPSYNHKVLPITAYVQRIAETIRENPVTIIQVLFSCLIM